MDSQELFDRMAVLNFGQEGVRGQSFASRIFTEDPQDAGSPGFRIGFKIEKDTSSTVNKAEPAYTHRGPYCFRVTIV